jgi:hypothetical protein
VLVTTVLFPPMQLTTGVRRVQTTRALLARHLRDIAEGLRRGAVLVDDLTMLVVEFQPHRRGLDRMDGGTGRVLAEALDSLAGVVCVPYPTANHHGVDARAAAIDTAEAALRRLTTLLRTSEVADDEGFFALGAVTVGMYRSLDTLRSRPRDPHPA